MKLQNPKDMIYKEPMSMMHPPKDYKPATTNLSDPKKVREYFAKKRGK